MVLTTDLITSERRKPNTDRTLNYPSNSWQAILKQQLNSRGDVEMDPTAIPAKCNRVLTGRVFQHLDPI
jgi:hypothetical protein